jgi:hypothetical protein
MGDENRPLATGDFKMTESSPHRAAVRAHWQFSLGELFRTQAGAAGVVAVAAYIHRLHSGWPVYYVSGVKFATVTVLSALFAYVACRCFLGRFTGLLAGMALAGMAGSLFLWRRGDDMREFAVLGMLVACSLFMAVGWIDRCRAPFLRRSGPPGGSSIN